MMAKVGMTIAGVVMSVLLATTAKTAMIRIRDSQTNTIKRRRARAPTTSRAISGSDLPPCLTETMRAT